MIFYQKVGIENDHGLAILANFGGGSRCYFVRDTFDFVLSARARARARAADGRLPSPRKAGALEPPLQLS